MKVPCALCGKMVKVKPSTKCLLHYHRACKVFAHAPPQRELVIEGGSQKEQDNITSLLQSDSAITMRILRFCRDHHIHLRSV